MGKTGHHQRKQKRITERTWRPIAERIASAHGITVNQMLWHGQARTYFMPRALFWKELRDLGRFSYPSIAKITGHDHTTVMGACRSDAVKAYASTHQRQAEGPNLIGQRFGSVTVVERAPAHKGHDNPRYRCRCDCGRVKTLTQPQLLDTGPKAKTFCFSTRIPAHVAWMADNARTVLIDNLERAIRAEGSAECRS